LLRKFNASALFLSNRGEGLPGHSCASVTERYARLSPDFMSHARVAINDYFAELQPLVERRLVFNRDLRVNSVLAED